MTTNYTTLHLDRRHELLDLAEAWQQEQIAARVPAHIDRLRADPAQLTDAINDYLFDNDNMAKLVRALLVSNHESLLFLANLRVLVQSELQKKARAAAEQEVDADK